jgi:adenylylsulfate kinase
LILRVDADTRRKFGRLLVRKKPTALFIGRYQPSPWQPTYNRKAVRRVGQVCLAVRDTHGIDARIPSPSFAAKYRIEVALSACAERFAVAPLSNITNVFYGRNVRYPVERIVRRAISATKRRTE